MHITLPRTTVILTGDDRASFLTNFCTADIKSMGVGEIGEAFILNLKGKLLGHVLVFCHQDRIELNTVAGQANALIEHLDRFLIREDVELSDLSDKTQHTFVFGDSAEIQNLAFNRFTESAETPEQESVRTAYCEVAGRGLLFSANSNCSSGSLEAAVQQVDSERASEEQLQLHRVQEATPWYGIDFDANNLPQELQRDDKAISFTKGCYLGQETVARIDSLGRVNKLLVQIQSSHPIQTGQKLLANEKEVGTISSTVPNGDRWLGLAIVKRDAAQSGTSLTGDGFTAIVQ